MGRGPDRWPSVLPLHRLVAGLSNRLVVEADLRLVRFLWCGNDGTVRAKASGTHGLEQRLQSGIGVTVAMQAMTAWWAAITNGNGTEGSDR